MRKLPEVEEARALMTEAKAWSVMKWLKEKKRVRSVADKANAALDDLNRTVKARWSEELRVAYDHSGVSKPRTSANGLARFVQQVKEADDAAARARMDAERTFDEAERRMSTSLAREGCDKAILSWDLYEKAIRQAEQ
jgi:hypothetical protein